MKPKRGYIVGVGSRLDNFQTGLDVIGMTEIPFVSQGADLASGVISLATGDYVGAALSVGSLIPGIGQATGAAKMARRASKVMDAASNMKGTAKQTENLLELTGKSKGIKTSPPKAKQQAIAKNSEVDAKPAKKEHVREREDVPNDKKQETELEGNGLTKWDNEEIEEVKAYDNIQKSFEDKGWNPFTVKDTPPKVEKIPGINHGQSATLGKSASDVVGSNNKASFEKLKDFKWKQLDSANRYKGSKFDE